ncbi:DUF2290 domain-containing protein [Halomonas sp. LS-001]
MIEIDFLRQASVLESLNLNADFMYTAFRTKIYQDVYDSAIENQCFNFAMADGALFQFTEIDENTSRYAFFPNPYSFESYKEHLGEIERISHEEGISLEECEQILSEGSFFNIDMPCIRFDKDYNAYCKDYHPVAHLHVGFFSENRWPVKKILTPYAFFLFVLRTYYQEKWIEYKEKLDLDEIYLMELDRVNFISEDFFSSEEKRRIHLT